MLPSIPFSAWPQRLFSPEHSNMSLIQVTLDGFNSLILENKCLTAISTGNENSTLFKSNQIFPENAKITLFIHMYVFVLEQLD